jgi:hypothetical protein
MKMRKKNERFLKSVDLLEVAGATKGATAFVYENLSRRELRDFADRVAENDPDAIEFATRFFERETKGTWHNRARAMLARRFKHCELNDSQKRRVQSAIYRRLHTGEFFEHFKDQLRLALHFDRGETITEAAEASKRPVPHVIQYSRWILEHDDQTGEPGRAVHSE